MLNGLKTSLFYILGGSCRFRLAMSPTSPPEVIFLAMKDIPGFVGLYAATADGKIWSYPKEGKGGHNGKFLRFSTDRDGYKRTILCKNGVRKCLQVHRLIALTYITNLEEKPQINHKNGIPHDNCVENLEWCTSSENNLHSFRMNGRKSSNSRKVYQYSLSGENIGEYESIRQAQKETGISAGNICQCALGNKKYGTAGGYIWKYQDTQWIHSQSNK